MATRCRRRPVLWSAGPQVNGKPVAGCAGLTNPCSFLPDSASILSQMADELTDYIWSKGTLNFSIDQPPPVDRVRRHVN